MQLKKDYGRRQLEQGLKFSYYEMLTMIIESLPEVFVIEQDNPVPSSYFSCTTADAQIIDVVIICHRFLHSNKRSQH